MHNVVAEPSSGTKALTAFLAGTGNVLLAYEADALAAQRGGQADQHRLPGAEHPDPDARRAHQRPAPSNKGAKAFFAYLFSPAGQSVWAHNCFRPTLPSVAKATRSAVPARLSLRRT